MKVYFLLLIFLCSMNIQAQRDYRIISTNEYMDAFINAKDDYKKESKKIEKAIKKASRKGLQFNKVYLPIVFHNIYNNEGQKITIQQIDRQLETLNEAFGNYLGTFDSKIIEKESWSSRIADLEIQFCYAPSSITNNPFSQIYSESTSFQVGQEMKDKKKGADPVKPDKVINVWIVDLNESAGYAQMPGGDKKYDGIVIDYEYFQQLSNEEKPYDDGKTLVHLMGNYLGLYSLWGPGPCEDDFVFDTPIHNAPNYECPVYRHVSLCEGRLTEMTMNYMDNTDDDCTNMFTVGQKVRLYAMLLPGLPRNSLIGQITQCSEVLEAIAEEPNIQIRNNSIEANIYHIFPNPAENLVNIKPSIPIENGIGYLYNLSGLLVKTVKLNGSNIQVDISDVATGTYHFAISENNKLVFSQAIVVLNH